MASLLPRPTRYHLAAILSAIAEQPITTTLGAAREHFNDVDVGAFRDRDARPYAVVLHSEDYGDVNIHLHPSAAEALAEAAAHDDADRDEEGKTTRFACVLDTTATTFAAAVLRSADWLDLTAAGVAADVQQQADRTARRQALEHACASGGALAKLRPAGAPLPVRLFDETGEDSALVGTIASRGMACFATDHYLVATTSGRMGFANGAGMEVTAYQGLEMATGYIEMLLNGEAETSRVVPHLFHLTHAGLTSTPLEMRVSVGRTQATPAAATPATVSAEGR